MKALVVCTAALGAWSALGVAPASAQRVIVVDRQPVVIRADPLPITVPPDRFVQADDPTAPARLQEKIAQLGSTDAQLREQTTQDLIRDNGISLAMIDRAIREGGDKLSLEARQRLVTVAQDRFWRTPRGALGIVFWNSVTGIPINRRDRAVIGRTVDKFDSAGKLEMGDVIIEADGRKIEASRNLQSAIVSHDPGETIRLVVRRGDEKLNLDVRLGRRDDLPDAPLDDSLRMRAWNVRAASMMPETAHPILIDVKPGDWQATPVGQDRMNRMGLRQKGADLPGVGAVGGGMPRGADLSLGLISSQKWNPTAFRGNNRALQQQIIWQQQAMWGGGLGWDANGDPLPATPVDRRQELQDLLLMQASLVRDVQRTAMGPPVQAPMGRNPGQLGFTAAENLEIVKRQISAVKAEMIENNEAMDDQKTETTGADGDQPKR
jgi:hypothetical protein